MIITLNETSIRERIIGCWLGKAAGGTLGMPFEGINDTLDLTGYDPEPTQMVPNDDLDLQVLHACLLMQMQQPRIHCSVLVKAWEHVGYSPDEYGVVKRNLKLGLHPPLTGAYDNWFVDGMGAAIRTELWACLAPGEPERAAAYAEHDAVCDHAGEGVQAARFLAAMESLAFVENNINILLDKSLALLPADNMILRAVNDVRNWYTPGCNWQHVQRKIMQFYGSQNFTDVTMNLAFIVLGLLEYRGDFGRGVCTAVNCGQDTDCTGATLGGLLGIIDPEGLTEQWLKPLGRRLRVDPLLTGIHPPDTLDGFTDLVINLGQRLEGQMPEPISDNQVLSHSSKVLNQLAVRTQVGFANWLEIPNSVDAPAMPEQWQERWMPGSIGNLTADTFPQSARFAIVRYQLHFKESQHIRLICNTAGPMRLYWDGKLLIGRDGGWVCPAFHRAPLHQYCTATVETGTYTVDLILPRPTNDTTINWLLGIGAETQPAVCIDWLIDPYERRNHLDQK